MCAMRGHPACPAVLLPGTGSDEVFVRSVFRGPLAATGTRLLTPPLSAGRAVIAGYLAALYNASADGVILAGGVSLGAHVATEWALRNPDRCAGLILALPAWTGAPADAPASLAARFSADLVERDGLDAALETATAGVDPWLADELRRAWPRHGSELAAGLRTAANHPAPELAALRELDIPVGIAACTDDAVHPVAVAHAWADALPRAAVRETTLAALGADRESLGRAAVEAWRQVVVGGDG